MFLDEDLPDSQLERAQMLQEMLVAHATGNGASNQTYQELRREFIADATLKPLLPSFIRTCRSLDQFWGYIKRQSGQYQPRREHIWTEFGPLLDHLEGRARAPADLDVGDTLATFDQDGTHAVWQKALTRRQSDPGGAITAARSLLETVCKRILDEEGVSYDEKVEMPALYHQVAEQLNLAPCQHTETAFRSILGNCQQVVNNLANLRNKIGDAHGRGGRPVRPAPRHAALCVNLAGTMATFLVETWIARREAPSIE